MAWFLPLIFFVSSLEASSVKEFEELLGNICVKPCGVDALRDQKDRKLVNNWLIEYEKTPAPLSHKRAELCQWYKEDLKRANPLFTSEKQNFVEARIHERKSPLKGVFSPAC